MRKVKVNKIKAISKPPVLPLFGQQDLDNNAGNLNEKNVGKMLLTQLAANLNMKLLRLCLLKSLEAEVQICRLSALSFLKQSSFLFSVALMF